MSSAYNHGLLQADNVSFSYSADKKIINNFNLNLTEGEFIGLLGANGSGKSTILKLASGILKPNSGYIKLWNKSLESYTNKDRAKLLSYLPQILDLNVPFKVCELVEMGCYAYEIPPEMTIEEAIDIVGLGGKSESYVTNLSGGERRRVFIAMTLLQGAGLLLLDEPFANLDIKYQLELLCLLKKLRDKKNISIIMALHDINIALQFEKVMLIKEGTILGVGSPETVLSPEMLKQAFDVDIEMLRRNGDVSFIMERR